MNVEAYTGCSQELGLDITASQRRFSSRRYQEEEQADLQFATELVLHGTRIFFLNGRTIV